MSQQFLYDTSARKGRWRDEGAEAAGLYTAYHFTGEGTHGLEVAYATADQQPNRTTVRDVWKQRHGRAAAPLMVVVGYPKGRPTRALVCGPAGENPPVLDVDHGHAERLADAALREPNRHHAIRFLAGALDGDPEQLHGLRNKGLLATHELERGVPRRADWSQAVERSQPLLIKRNHDLVRGLGYDVVQQGEHSILRTSDNGTKRAVAVFLQASEQPDEPSSRHGAQTPVTYALTQAEREGLTWVLAVRGGSIRLYSTSTAGAAGQRGRAETYVELALPLLPSERAGYLDLLFSPRALAPGGTIEEIQRASADYTAQLSKRLRERVYNQVVPRLAVAVASQRGGTGEEDLDSHYRTSLTILFRLLFIAYAEDSRLLPLHVNDDFTRNALKSVARGIADRINSGGDLGFDNPFTTEVEPATDAAHADLWDRCQELFNAVDKGHNRWGIPPYNGGLFSSDGEINPVGPTIAALELSNGDFGPALAALLVDRTPDGDVGPIDFRSLSVREFGTIYEGLLESELSVADRPLTIDPDGAYLPAKEDDDVVVEAGDVYLHNQSGVRKATGSYFTKPFAVEHLIDHAVEPTLSEHLDRVREALDADRPADAADLIFDFRVADIAMGSGHFLTAVVDRLEARYTEFLTRNPIPQITAELDRLRGAAEKALGDLAETSEIENSSLLRRLIARRCVYGIDINPVSVELARVAMWIHTFVPGLPLSFLDHNLVVGDSLSGVGTIEEAAAALDPAGGAGLFSNQIRDQLRLAEEPLRRLANISDATPDDIEKAREADDDAREAAKLTELLFDFITAARMGEVGMPVTPDAVASEDAEVRDQARTIANELDVLHLPVAFPEVFLRDRAGFDVLLGNPPWDKVRHEPQQFWVTRMPGLNALPASDRDDAIERLRRERPHDAAAEQTERARREKFQEFIGNAYSRQGRGHYDYAKLFVERALQLTGNHGAIGYVLPRQCLVLGGWSELRDALVERGNLRVVQARNAGGWFFDDVHNSYMVVLLASTPSGEFTTAVWPAVKSVEELEQVHSIAPVELSLDDLRQLSDTLVIPWLEDLAAIPVFEQMRQHHRLAHEGGWITGSSDSRWDFSGSGKHKQLATTEPSHDGWRVLMTRHVTPYAIDESRDFRRFIPSPERLPTTLGVSHEPTTHLAPSHPAITYRYASRNDDTRTLIACVLPREGFLYSTGYEHGIETDGHLTETLALLGVMNSYCCDWWSRRIVDRHVTAPVINNLPLPDWSPDDVEQAGAVVGELVLRSGQESVAGLGELERSDGATDRTEEDLLIDLEVLVAAGYGLSASDVETILGDFSPGACSTERRKLIVERLRS